MKNTAIIDSDFIENSTNFKTLISALKTGFSSNDYLVPLRHHHDFPNPDSGLDSTLLLMPAWHPGQNSGVKIVTVSPDNAKYNLPAIHSTYIYLDSITGKLKAILEAKSLTVKRTAAASALASLFLSRENSESLLMIGTGALSTNLIEAHASIRPIKKVYVYGRDYNKAKAICKHFTTTQFTIEAIKTIEEKISEVDIISSATLSTKPLVIGKHLKPGQHVDLVGAYKKDTREADDEAILKSSVYIDTYQGGLKESGDILIPLNTGILKENDIQADLFELCGNQKTGRKNDTEITLFKSVGHALEDLLAATYYVDKYAKTKA
ncbi:ornithine cyclodeaminase family protein [Formosa sp. L2A11]|uniref:ornithine cyclodeaminase family protein n=1 Tax=Formosa sp. L2A11 TaxID=2686363 RepID=UPI00131D5926|nr:ornithine cyclodeaminase family protein [Formosa sp. L2A11]